MTSHRAIVWEDVLERATERGVDPMTLFASEYYMIKFRDVTTKQRSHCKDLLFPLMYGGKPTSESIGGLTDEPDKSNLPNFEDLERLQRSEEG